MRRTILIFSSLIILSLACTRPRPPTPVPTTRPVVNTVTALPPPITTTPTRLPTEPPPTQTPTSPPSPTPPHTLTPHPPPTATPIIYHPPTPIVQIINYDNTRYRTGPGVQHPAYGHLHRGHQVEMLIEVLNEINERWCQIVNERWPTRADTYIFCELLKQE